MADRTSKRIGPFTLGAGGAHQSVTTAESFALQTNGDLCVQCIIDGGNNTTAPADLPIGTWQLWIAGDDTGPFLRWLPAESGPQSLAQLAAVGNVLVNAAAAFEKTPLARAKLVYARASGGASSRATLIITRS
jgi:hypothetical protein